MTSQTLRVLNTAGLHARPAGLFIETANRFRSAIRVTKGDREVDGKSVLGLMLLEITADSELTITAEGEDEEQALEALSALITGRFGE